MEITGLNIITMEDFKELIKNSFKVCKNDISSLKEENILTERHGIHVKGLYKTSEDECQLKELVKQIDIYS